MNLLTHCVKDSIYLLGHKLRERDYPKLISWYPWILVCITSRTVIDEFAVFLNLICCNANQPPAVYAEVKCDIKMIWSVLAVRLFPVVAILPADNVDENLINFPLRHWLILHQFNKSPGDEFWVCPNTPLDFPWRNHGLSWGIKNSLYCALDPGGMNRSMYLMFRKCFFLSCRSESHGNE